MLLRVFQRSHSLREGMPALEREWSGARASIHSIPGRSMHRRTARRIAEFRAACSVELSVNMHLVSASANAVRHNPGPQSNAAHLEIDDLCS